MIWPEVSRGCPGVNRSCLLGWDAYRWVGYRLDACLLAMPALRVESLRVESLRVAGPCVLDRLVFRCRGCRVGVFLLRDFRLKAFHRIAYRQMVFPLIYSFRVLAHPFARGRRSIFVHANQLLGGVFLMRVRSFL